MSSLTSAIEDAIEDYVRLCEKYHEMIQRLENGLPDCYGLHAEMLRKQERKDNASS